MGSCWSDGKGGGRGGGGMVGVCGTTSGCPNDAVDYYLKSRGFNGLFSQIELSFSASNLRDGDVISKSDAMVVVYTKGRDGITLSELFRSEVVLNSLNPKWIKKLTLSFQFELVQTLLFRVYDIDTQFQNSREEMLKLDEQQFLGEATCALSEIITKSNRTVALELMRKESVAATAQPQNYGKLVVHAEESLASKTTTEIVLRCLHLEPMDHFSKSDPFLVISKMVEHGSPIPVSKTEVLKNDANPVWKPVFLSVQQVGSKDSPLVIECLDFNGNGNHSLIGKVEKSLAELEKLHVSGQGINLLLPTGVGHKHEDKALKSQISVDKFTETVQHTFLEYLASGFELNFMVAIDFTASNGNPRLPDSLHYIDPTGRLNAYQRAIVEVGEVLQFYDTDKKFPAWGFGARPIDIPVSHCFNLNGSSTYCEVDGIQGIMNAYNGALFNVSFAGPTLFGPVINAASTIASESLAQNSRRYYVLLIITDGVITDLQETRDALVSASDLPLSILIVGVGGADYKEMEVLDGDKGERLESSSGRVASRDVVQFVALKDIQYGEVSVVEALLAELPSQFLAYMKNRNITPTTTTTTSAS
ncbi:Protein BONZAI 2 [Raphanus sativus]|uniref:Protein BONZAI 2 isoform X2 n=1 Tax=Raphanus sativus TaxID=3726 RepID=A0A6J0K3T2_RAPSA|nr:protein BONZAI 2 isoform X2 [Raphanus sativus]KAJ4883283.1 Protein BONZAI 2 [Raphanus sativus]